MSDKDNSDNTVSLQILKSILSYVNIDFVSTESQLNLGYSNRIGGGSFSNLYLDELSIWEVALNKSQIETILNFVFLIINFIKLDPTKPAPPVTTNIFFIYIFFYNFL